MDERGGRGCYSNGPFVHPFRSDDGGINQVGFKVKTCPRRGKKSPFSSSRKEDPLSSRLHRHATGFYDGMYEEWIKTEKGS
ncbi:hypothetical protein NPIL_637071 [Nephila pilipes]|uniref:Uncharacterized protein n=1 Tax=Nephila pilipes TaxID=299642 RepID=A0A8X6IVJ7_NEPPI|nr:hypothetical protein NPIL_637071 [Nephila pilipes]